MLRPLNLDTPHSPIPITLRLPAYAARTAAPCRCVPVRYAAYVAPELGYPTIAGIG